MITLPNECKLILVYIVVTLLGDGNELPGYRLDQTYIRRDVCVIYSPDRCRREKTSCIRLPLWMAVHDRPFHTVFSLRFHQWYTVITVREKHYNIIKKIRMGMGKTQQEIVRKGRGVGSHTKKRCTLRRILNIKKTSKNIPWKLKGNWDNLHNQRSISSNVFFF